MPKSKSSRKAKRPSVRAKRAKPTKTAGQEDLVVCQSFVQAPNNLAVEQESLKKELAVSSFESPMPSNPKSSTAPSIWAISMLRIKKLLNVLGSLLSRTKAFLWRKK